MPDLTVVKNQANFALGSLFAKDIACAVSSRAQQNMSLFYGDTSGVLINRKKFLDNVSIDYQDLVCAKQIHGSCVKYVGEEDRGRGALSYDSSITGTDALVTDRKNLPLAIFTADCLSVFLYDPGTGSIGLIHAGWRSTKENITIKAVQLMQKHFNTKAENLYVGFGPSIRDCCYEVSIDFNESFPHNLIKRNNHYYLDLVAINKEQALYLGVKENCIFDSKICTFCRNEEFFSYRREGKVCGRMISVIMLKG